MKHRSQPQLIHALVVAFLISVFLFTTTLITWSAMAGSQSEFRPLGFVRAPRGTYGILARSRSAIADRYIIIGISTPEELPSESEKFGLSVLQTNHARMVENVGIGPDLAKSISLDSFSRIGWPFRFASTWSGVNFVEGKHAGSGLIITRSDEQLELTSEVRRVHNVPRIVFPVCFEFWKTLGLWAVMYGISLALVYLVLMLAGRL